MSISAADVVIYAPTASSSVAVATAASTFVSVATARRVWIVSSVDAHINFGPNAAGTVVTTTNIPVPAWVPVAVDRKSTAAGAPDAGFKVKLVGTTAGTLWYASV